MSKEELVKEAEEYALNTYEMCSYSDLPYASDRRAREQAYIAAAEPREKQIEIDAEQIRTLQKQNGELTDKVRELEAQLANKGDCECLTCVCRDSSCTRSDYGKDEIGLCKRYKSIYELHKELEQQIEQMKCWHNMDYNDKESCKKIPRGIQLLTEYDCGLFVAYCVNRWTGDHWEEHHYGITRWKEIKENG